MAIWLSKVLLEWEGTDIGWRVLKKYLDDFEDNEEEIIKQIDPKIFND